MKFISFDNPIFIVTILMGLVLGAMALGIRLNETRPGPSCADYADLPRESTPSRCFADFRPRN